MQISMLMIQVVASDVSLAEHFVCYLVFVDVWSVCFLLQGTRCVSLAHDKGARAKLSGSTWIYPVSMSVTPAQCHR